MNQPNKILLGLALVLGSVVLTQTISPSIFRNAVAATEGCGCNAEPSACDSCEAVECDACTEGHTCTKRTGCKHKRCQKPRKKINCPSCAVECDTCTLELDHYEEEKTCFKTEQKIVCIPPVRYPWEKCCPPGRTSKTRAVTLLKVHKYKCKACGYKWKLDPLPEPCGDKDPETDGTPEAPESKSTTEPEGSVDPVVAPVTDQNLLSPTEAPQPEFEPEIDVPVPDLGEVPQAPAS
jgi:hypothetical protein